MKWKAGTVVFERDDWTLVKQRTPGDGTRRMHRHGAKQYTIDLDAIHCAKCDTAVPDDIQGLWMIANWERLSG